MTPGNLTLKTKHKSSKLEYFESIVNLRDIQKIIDDMKPNTQNMINSESLR